MLIALSCAGRLTYLDADPSFPTWIGYVVDEGRWSETARNLVLFGDPDVNWLSRLHLFISPGYQAVNYLVFRAFGVDFWSARIFSAIAGILVLLTVVVALRRNVTPLALAFGVVILGLETNVFWASRIAMPEMPAVLATLLAFFLLVLGQKTLWSAALAGLLAVVAVAMKGTTVLALLIFPAIALTVPLGAPVKTRMVRAGAFIAGFALPVCAGIALLSVLGYLKADAVGAIARSFLDFLSWTGAYPAVSRFFDATELEARNLLLLGAWFCSWLWLYRQPRSRCTANALYLASGIWAGWWLFVWSANTYLPGRYQVHFIVPAAIHIMAGLSLGSRDTVTRIVATLAQRRRLRNVSTLCWLIVPTAIVFASVAVGLAWLGDWNADRLSERLALVAALAALLTSFVSLRPVDERLITGFLSFPIAMALVWLGGREVGLFHSFWMFESLESVELWSASASVLFVLCFVLAPQIRVQSAIGAVAVALLASIFLTQAAPPILFPTYSVRDASRDLKHHLPPDRPVRTVTAASLFLENGFKYHELPGDDQEIDRLVIFEHGGAARRFLHSEKATQLIQTHAYPLKVSPRYQATEGMLDAPVVRVYRAK
ncbi:MAG: hypothetical protein M3Q28_00490 [Pseudomonadota bacterium]|nr:hypothetical protein [Pseudomonadota bacterium]